jgi:hypothetical protein
MADDNHKDCAVCGDDCHIDDMRFCEGCGKWVCDTCYRAADGLCEDCLIEWRKLKERDNHAAKKL